MKMLKSLILVVVLLVVAAAGYSALWYYQANRLQKNLEEQLASASKEHAAVLSFQYDAINKSGYPIDIQISLVNPRVKALGIVPILEGQENPQAFEMNLNGQIVDTFNVFGYRKAMEATGKARILLPKINIYPASEWVVEGKIGAQSDALSFISDMILHPITTKIDTLKEFTLTLAPLRFSCVREGKELEVLDVKNALIEYQKKVASYFIHIAGDVVASNDVELFPFKSGKETMQDFADRIAQAYGKKMGKTSSKLDMKIELPDLQELEQIMNSPMSLLARSFPTFSIDLGTFESSNNFSASQAKGFFKLNEDAAKNVSIQTAFESIWKGKANYNDLMSVVDELAKAVTELQPTTATETKLKNLFASHLDDIKALVPHLEKFGAVEFKEAGSAEFNKATFSFKGVLEQLKLSSDLYGMNVHGGAEYQGGKALVKFTLDLMKYRDFIQDSLGYYNRLTVVLNQLRDEKEALLRPVSAETISKIIAYLQKISDEPTSESADLHITCSFNNGEIQVGTLNIVDFQVISKTLLGELDKELNPPAPQVK